MNQIELIIQKQQIYEFRKRINYPVNHSLAASYYPLLEQNLIAIQKTGKRQKCKQLFKYFIAILLLILFLWAIRQ